MTRATKWLGSVALGLAIGPVAAARAQVVYTFTTINDPNATAGSTRIFGVGNSGAVAGNYSDAQGNSHGFAYSNGTYTTIDYPGAATGTTTANAVNTSGTVVGGYNDAQGNAHGFTFNNGVYTTLNIPADGGTTRNLLGINDSGVVSGYRFITNNPATPTDAGYQGFISSGGNSTSLVNPNAQTGATFAFGLNNKGAAAGYFIKDNQTGNLGFVYNPVGGYTTLTEPNAMPGPNPTSQGTFAWGINDAGTVAGYYYDPNASAHGFVYGGGAYATLDVPTASNTFATGINNAGEVVGYYNDITGDHGFIATPVPEPGSLALVAAGGAVMAGIARRRTRKAVAAG